MRKTTLLLGALLAFFNAAAQLPDGSTAPDFTATDLNGNTHSLSTYLSQGKTVILDISATWCGPCWNYHNSKALDNMYNAYGANGSDEVVVLFVEGDANTTLADLNGTGTNTRGNWVAGTSYPIIDSAAIGNLYQIGYFPTVYRICPDGTTTEIGALDAPALRASINSGCGPINGLQNHVEVLETVSYFCSDTGAPVARLRNYGTNTLASGTIALKQNGVVAATRSFTGSTAQFNSRSVTFNPLTFDPSAEYSFEIIELNSTVVNPSDFSTEPTELKLAVNVAPSITVKIYTDNYPTEMSWRIKRASNNAIIASGGPYVGNTNGGGADANTVKIQNVTLPANDCYSIDLLDSFGDGWSIGSLPQKGLEIVQNDEVVLFIDGSNFTNTLARPNQMTSFPLSVEENEKVSIGLFPNPSNGLVTFQSDRDADITISDMQGKVVFTKAGVIANGDVNLTGLQSGIYIATLKTGDNILTQKLVIK